MRRKSRKKSKTRKEPFFYRKFPTLDEIKCYLKQITKEFPHIIRLEQIGHSCEGRSIDMVIIQKNRCFPKNATMIEAGIHAREWLGHTTVLYIINYIIRHQEMLDYMDYYIIPCLNPDGYNYTHKRRRLWRKNMNKNGCKAEVNWGVDINRNFSYGYGLRGSSSNPASLMYRGRNALSEPETRSLANALDTYGEYVKLYIAIHCYGNLIMYPWGYTTRPIRDEKDLRACGYAAKRAMKSAFPDSCFRVGSLWKVMYRSSGGSSDYARGEHHIKFSFTMELHKGGKYGFDPPPTRILKVARETTVGVVAMIEHVHNYYSCRKRKLSSAVSSPCKRRKYCNCSSEDSDSLSSSCDY